MGLGVRRSRTPCFCAESCPAGTYPFEQYWIKAPAPLGPQYGLNAYLYRFVGTGSGGLCIWRAVTDHFFGPSLEELTKTTVAAPPGFMAYRFDLVLLDGTGINQWTQTYTTALPEPPGLVQPGATNSCSRIIKLLTHVVLGVPWFAQMTPAYPDACDDADFPAKEQTKPFAAF